jgi:hypothetical protein
MVQKSQTYFSSTGVGQLNQLDVENYRTCANRLYQLFVYHD